MENNKQTPHNRNPHSGHNKNQRGSFVPRRPFGRAMQTRTLRNDVGASTPHIQAHGQTLSHGQARGTKYRCCPKWW